MSATAIGIGLGVLVLLVVLYFILIKDDNSTEEEVPEPEAETNDPPCSDFECEEGLEPIEGKVGTTARQCCQKPLCPLDICTANGVEFKDPKENARGDTVNECCVDALCTIDKCNEGYKLNGNRLGRTNDECCIEKPLCFPREEDPSASGTNFPCPTTHTPKEGSRGSSRDECCKSKTCVENGWGDSISADGDDAGNSGRGCEEEGLSPKDNISTIRGFTKEVCCQHPLCTGSSITCPEGKKLDDTGKLRGSDADTCCISKTCEENEWDKESFIPPGSPEGTTPIGISKCKFYSNQTKTKKDDLKNVIGNSVGECCEEKLCSNNYFYDERCPDESIDVTSPCFKLENIIPGKPLSTGNMKKNCALLKKKLAPDGTLMPVTVEERDSTCCVSLNCGEEKALDPDNDKYNCGPSGKFNPDGISTIDSADDSADDSAKPCCSETTCAESYQGNDKCVDPATYGKNLPTDLYVYSRYGGSSDKVRVKVENMKYDITKGTSPAGPGCCIPKTCAEEGFNDEKCLRRSSGKKISDPTKGGEFVKEDGIESCCRSKPCSQQSEEDLNTLCSWNMTKKAVLPTEGEASRETCCEYRTCADIGWDDAKCKDRNYTRASARGKAKKTSEGDSISLDSNTLTDGEPKHRSLWEPTLVDSVEGNFEGDDFCCEQDLKNNFARMCVGDEWLGGTKRNLSPGANITEEDGHPIRKIGTSTRKTSDQCMATCKENNDCYSFSLTANTEYPNSGTQGSPSCDMYGKLGSSVNVNELITSEWGHKRTTLQYFSGNTFPEQYRYSGGTADINATDKFLTCEKTDQNPGGACNTKWDSSDTVKYSGRKGRNRATTIAWGNNSETSPYKSHSKRKEIYLAGVDREFCPVDFVKHYGTWRVQGFKWGVGTVGVTNGTYHGENSEPLVMTDGNEGGIWPSLEIGDRIRDPAGCDAGVGVNVALDDCYRNLNCNWSWLSSAEPPDEGSQGDGATSAVFRNTLGSSRLSDSLRRVCHKKNFNKSGSTWPRHIDVGGASISPTRMIVDGEEGKKKLKFGVMPDKAPTSDGDAYWKNMIISGDSSMAD